MAWFKHLDPENPYWRGNGIGEALGDELEIDEYAAKTQKAFLYNNGVPAGIASAEGLGQVQLDKLKDDFNQKQVGFWNAMRIFWSAGKIDFKQLQPNFADTKIMELRKDERDKLVSAFGPPEIFGILDHSNRATIAEARPIYAELTLTPRLEFLRHSLQERLVPEFDERLLIEYVDPTPDDNAFRLEVAKAAPKSRSINEWRQLQSLPPIDDGDQVPSQMGPPAPGAGGAGPTTLPTGKGADPAWVAELVKSLGGGTQTKDTDAVGRVLKKLKSSELSNRTSPVTDLETRAWMESTYRTLGVAVDWKLVNPKIAEHIREQAGDRIKGEVNETTKKQLREELSDGVDAGESVQQLRKRVRSVFEDAAGYRAEAIARTEVCRSSGWATAESFRDSGVVEKREWVATPGPRTRDAHAAMDTQVRGVDEDFEAPDGETADHPGGFGVPELDINCRCTQVAKIEDKSLIGRTGKFKTLTKTIRLAEWKAYDAAVQPWEDKLRAAVVEGFKAQEATMLEAVEALAA